MKRYTVSSRFGQLGIAGFLGVISVFLFSRVFLAFKGVINENTPGDGVETVITSLFLLLFLSATVGYTRKVIEIRITERGTVVFVRAIGSSSCLSKDIRRLHGQYDRDYEGHQVWRFRIFYGYNHREEFGAFPNVLDFVEKIRALNPKVEITGLWPMSVPGIPST